jgi:phage shock protein PspC (stress-responsive transcriptional regulator)
MTTTDFGGYPPPPPPTSAPDDPPPRQRLLRRSRTDRIGGGVAGGLGEYFRVDPVLFRVLFATAAFFGGAGVLAYLLAWAAIPEQGTVNAPIDRFIRELRRRRVPVWLVAVVAGLVLWGVAFSWWAPGRFFPVIVVVIVLVAVFGRRARTGYVDGSQSEPVPVSFDKAAPGAAPDEPPPSTGNVGATGETTWMGETRRWMTEAREVSRERRRRALPVRLATLGALIVTLVALGVADVIGGIVLPTYFWVTGGIALLGLLVGAALRRTPWSMAPLLIPAIAGLIAFGGTRASLHDGTGQRDWTPTSAATLAPSYRLAFGQGVLDLRHVGPLDGARTVDVTVAAGQVKVLLPKAMNATVTADVHIGVVTVDGSELDRTGGWNFSHVVLPPDGASGPTVTINVHLADGDVDVRHV